MRQLGRRGSILIISMAFMAFIASLGASLLLRSVNENRLGARSSSRQQAFHLADAAVERAAINLRTPEVTGDDVTAGTLDTGTYSIDPATSLGNNLYAVSVYGESDGEERELEAVFEISPQSVFQFAVFGDTALSVGGSAITDSYDSREGEYDEDTAGHNGDIGTNADTAGGVTVDGSIFIDGQVAVGADLVDPESIVTGYDPAFITGGTSPPTDTQDVVSQASEFSMPEVEVPAGLTCSDQTIGGNVTVVLPAGTYCYNNLTIQGGGTLTASGTVKVYLTGQFTAQGNSIVGYAADPTRMVFLVDGGGEATIEEGTITGSTKFYGGLFAPESEITITGNADVYGSIVASAVNLSGSASIHYDEAMETLTDISSQYEVELVSWREL